MTSRANPDHWDRLLKVVGRDDLVGDQRYITPADRVERMDEVDDIIANWTKTLTKSRATTKNRGGWYPCRCCSRYRRIK